MSNEAFLRGILENPLDDTVRLVYADYLEEHGGDERAEFIRVQCEYSRLYLAGVHHGDIRLHDLAAAVVLWVKPPGILT